MTRRDAVAQPDATITPENCRPLHSLAEHISRFFALQRIPLYQGTRLPSTLARPRGAPAARQSIKLAYASFMQANKCWLSRILSGHRHRVRSAGTERYGASRQK